MRGGAIGDELDQRRAGALARALGGPLGRGVHGEEVVAVDAQPRDAVARAARRERALLAAGEALEGRDRPLVVDHVEQHRGAVHRGEQQRVVEVGLGAASPRRSRSRRGRRSPLIAAAIAQPTACGNCVARLPEIENSRPGTEWYITGSCRPLHMSRVFDNSWHMRSTSFAAADELQALLAVRREQHVARPQRHRRCDRDRLLAGRLHVEGDLALALGAQHAVVVQPRQQHVPQAHLQHVDVEMRVPGPDRAVAVVEHADQVDRQVLDVGRGRGDVGPGDGAGRRQAHVAEVGGFAGARWGVRHVQTGLTRHRGSPGPAAKPTAARRENSPKVACRRGSVSIF